MTWKRLAFAGALIITLTAMAAATGATIIPALADPLAQAAGTPSPEVIRPSEPTPSASASPTPTPTPTPTGQARPAEAFADWAAELSGKVDIPYTALEAYGYADWVLQQTRPTCKLTWPTLAAIGKVTSDHARLSGTSLDSLGRAKPALIGPALTGADSDGGALDGDQSKDHAVGPMQMTPAMWRASGVDGDSDELADPQDVDDAVLSAGYQLCGSGGDLSVVANWKKAINEYHALGPQIEKIFEIAQTYGTKSKA